MREYFCAYHSYAKLMDGLSDAACGRIFKACLRYSASGEATELKTKTERLMLTMMMQQIDRDGKKYDEMCELQRERANKRWNAAACRGISGIAEDANEKEKAKTKAKDKAKDKAKAKTNTKENTNTKTKAKTNEIAKAPAADEPRQEAAQPPVMGDLSFFSENIQNVLREWLRYKDEQPGEYGPASRTALIEEVRDRLRHHPEWAVVKVIREAMANGWKGVNWASLEKSARSGRRWEEQYNSYDLDNLEIELSRDALRPFTKQYNSA